MDLILKQVNSASLTFASADFSTEGYKVESVVTIDSNNQITSLDNGLVFKTSEVIPASPVASFNQYGANISVNYNGVESLEDKCAILSAIDSFLAAATIKVRAITIN